MDKENDYAMAFNNPDNPPHEVNIETLRGQRDAYRKQLEELKRADDPEAFISPPQGKLVASFVCKKKEVWDQLEARVAELEKENLQLVASIEGTPEGRLNALHRWAIRRLGISEHSSKRFELELTEKVEKMCKYFQSGSKDLVERIAQRLDAKANEISKSLAAGSQRHYVDAARIVRSFNLED